MAQVKFLTHFDSLTEQRNYLTLSETPLAPPGDKIIFQIGILSERNLFQRELMLDANIVGQPLHNRYSDGTRIYYR